MKNKFVKLMSLIFFIIPISLIGLYLFFYFSVFASIALTWVFVKITFIGNETMMIMWPIIGIPLYLCLLILISIKITHLIKREKSKNN